MAIAVGDVVGHDLTAAATMGQIRSVYRAMIADGASPAGVVDRMQASWDVLGLERMATAVFGRMWPATGEVRLASAGHPPPLLVRDGTAELLPDRADDPARGVDRAGAGVARHRAGGRDDAAVHRRAGGGRDLSLQVGLAAGGDAAAAAGHPDPRRLCASCSRPRWSAATAATTSPCSAIGRPAL